MAKKLIITIASGLVILLVLAFAVLLVFSTQGYFSDVITWLLVGLIGILALFTVYMLVSRVADIVRRRDLDVEELSEQSIQTMLKTGEIPPVREVLAAQGNQARAKAKAAADKRNRKKTTEEAKNLRRLEALEKKKMAEIAAAKTQAGKNPQTAPIPPFAPARTSHHPTAALTPGAPNKAAATETEAVKRARREAMQRTAELELSQRRPEEVKRQAAAVQRDAETRRQLAVDSARNQAEAAAVARQKAAAMAARSQSFPAIRADQLPAFNTGILEETSAATDSRAHIFNKDPAGQAASYHTGNIWDRMNVRQSAAPMVGGQIPAGPSSVVPIQQFSPAGISHPQTDYTAASANFSPDSPAAQAVPPWQQLSPETGEPAEGGALGNDPPSWAAYAPAKPPKAWNTATGGRIPGDMASYAVPNTVPKDAATRTEEAHAKAAVAEAKVAATKAKTTTSKVEKAPAVEVNQEGATRPRGRPTKPKENEAAEQPKRPRGRPPKPKTEEELNLPKRPRGRPPKPKTEEELNLPKRPRGRPRKAPLPEDGVVPETQQTKPLPEE